MALSVGKASYQDLVDLLDAILPLSKRPSRSLQRRAKGSEGPPPCCLLNVLELSTSPVCRSVA